MPPLLMIPTRCRENAASVMSAFASSRSSDVSGYYRAAHVSDSILGPNPAILLHHGIAEGRVRAWISYMITAGVLQRAAAGGQPPFIRSSMTEVPLEFAQ
jgi:hypothetical protein